MKNTKEYFIEKYGEETGKDMYVSILDDTFLDEEEAWREWFNPETTEKRRLDNERRAEYKSRFAGLKRSKIGGKWGWLELKK